MSLQHVVPLSEYEPGQFRTLRILDSAKVTEVLEIAEKITMHGVLRFADFSNADIHCPHPGTESLARRGRAVPPRRPGRGGPTQATSKIRSAVPRRPAALAPLTPSTCPPPLRGVMEGAAASDCGTMDCATIKSGAVSRAGRKR